MHKALGRGLESLIPSAVTVAPREREAGESTVKVAVEKIKPNKYQPRTHFNEARLKELSDSILRHGLAQPLLVSPSTVPGEYDLIAGERRWRASQMAGLKEVSVVIRQANDMERFHLAIIENLQREDLNPIEEARAFKRLADEFNHTQEELSEIVGKERSVVANSLRLLNLAAEIQDAIAEGIISAGHGRILAGVSEESKQKTLAKRAITEKLTVREIEKIVADWKTVINEGAKKTKRIDAELVRLGEELQRRLGTKVMVSGKPSKGKIEIQYFSLVELERIAAQLIGKHPR